MAVDARSQAEAFLDWKMRSGGTFDRWASSKGFSSGERLAIQIQVNLFRAQGWRPLSAPEAVRRAILLGCDYGIRGGI